MIARSLLIAAVLASSVGCIVPRSAGYGFTAAPLGPGGADVGLSVGATYQQVTSAPSPSGGGGTSSATTRQTQIPSFEANAQLGLTDQLSLNLHASQAGLQPGVKVIALRDPVQLAIVPQVGGGFVNNGGSTTITTGTGGTTTSESDGNTNFVLMAGMRVLLSVPAGFYAGLGYDFQHTTTSTTDADDGSVQSAISQAHNVGGAVGFELRLGSIALRPELAVLFTPVIKNSSQGGGNITQQPDSSGLYLFPNITLSAVSPGK